MQIKLQKTEDENGYFHFEITDKIKDLIKEHINNNFKNLLSEFEHYFNANISVAKVIIKEILTLINLRTKYTAIITIRS